ncbi:MAG: T9SS type A sorting domain-containing protein, partial [Bacteroidales bacterium]|nr:T9SS type A sorting domain-containing protein [Bacteroidales bacterium]
DLGHICGISGDTTVANEPSELIKMNMIMNSQPNTFSNYLTFGYGIRHQNSTTLFISTNTDYPSYDKDTLNIYLANRPHLNAAIESFVGNVFLWDSIPDYNPMGSSGNRCIETDPFFINANDSIIFARYQNITPAQYCIGGGADVNLGNTAPGYYSFLANNLMAPNTIFPYLNISFGEIMEKRTTDNHFSMYEIIKDETVIVMDTLDNFTAPYVVSEPGPYSFSLSNTNYKIANKQGLAVMNAQFDLSNTNDANPPTLMTFRITGSDGLTRNTFSNTEQGRLLVSGFDFNMTTGKMIKPKEVRTYFKKYSDGGWAEIASVEHPEWFDSNTFGNFYTCELGEVFAQFVTDDYLDLKISMVDSAGNVNTYTWHPAAYIENTVGISQEPRNDEAYLQVNPNPVTDNGIVSFNLLQNSTVRLTVYNIKGQLQEVIANKTMIKGIHQMNWNVSEKLTPGIYMLKLEAKDIIKWVKVFVN